MTCTNYISHISADISSKNISYRILTIAIKHLRDNYIHEDKTNLKWQKDYFNQETFINGKSTTSNEYHLILPKFKYTFNLRVADEIPKYIIRSIAYNALILAQINSREEEFKNNTAFTEYYILLFTRRYAYQTYKNDIESNVKLWCLISSVVEYLNNNYDEAEYQKQIIKNSNTVCTVGNNLTSNQKKSISVKTYREKFDKERDPDEIEFIMNLYMKNIPSRAIAEKFKKKFKKTIAYTTVCNYINKYKGFYLDNIGLEDLNIE